MVGTTRRFIRGLFSLHPAWVVWVMTLAGLNTVGPILFWEALEARVILGTFAVAATLMMLFTARFGFTRILGAAHFPWFGLLPWLIVRLQEIPGHSHLWAFVLTVIVVNGTSLVIDTIDVIRYVRGDRTPEHGS